MHKLLMGAALVVGAAALAGCTQAVRARWAQVPWTPIVGNALVYGSASYDQQQAQLDQDEALDAEQDQAQALQQMANNQAAQQWMQTIQQGDARAQSYSAPTRQITPANSGHYVMPTITYPAPPTSDEPSSGCNPYCPRP